MAHIIIGTAGHVDHGKTALIRRLTGIDTDRLREEKERGLSIDLGFAYFDLPSGQRAGIVDVPGHERFIKNMLAGATCMDLVLLVVAADEGVMPQTREHLDIIHLLGVRAGILVLTKADLVEVDWLDLVEQEVREVVRGTIYETAPCVRVSSTTGEGFDELVRTIDQVAATVPPRDVSGPARLWVDRVFTVRGFGTVVTGTLGRGRLSVEEEVAILPAGRVVRIRGLEVHGEAVPSVTAAQRVALNLARIEKQDIQRGDVIAAVGSLQATFMLDVRVRVLPDAETAIRNRARLRVHIGTAEIIGRAYLLDSEELQAGEDGLAQLRLESPTVASHGDRLVLRRYSPMSTLAGATVIDPAPRRHRRYDAAVLEGLATGERGEPEEMVERLVWEAGAKGRSPEELCRLLQREPEAMRELLEALARKGRVRLLATRGRVAPRGGEMVIAASAFDALASRVTATLADYHERNRLRPAMPKSQLQAAVDDAEAAVLEEVLAELEWGGGIVSSSKGVRLAEHRVQLSEEQEGLVREVEARTRRAGFSPPALEQMLALSRDVGDVVAVCIERGTVIEIEGFLFHADTLARAKETIRRHIAQEGSLTVSQFRDLTQSSRKYAIPLLGYLDRTGFTRREGDLRYLAKGDSSAGWKAPDAPTGV